MLNSFLLTLTLLQPALAEEAPLDDDFIEDVDSDVPKLPKNTILIYEFEATDGSAYELSDRIPALLLGHMSKNADINAMAIKEMNDISKQTAVEYANGCPANEYAGCAYVLANASGVPYAITGSVVALEDGAQVTIIILDIESVKVDRLRDTRT